MSLPRETSPATEKALIRAHNLVDYGVPVFRGRLRSDGNPDTDDRRWSNWQASVPSHKMVDLWKPGEALCALTGTTFDVLDIDPRSGGDLSFKRLARELGDDGPETYWEVWTPSGGRHLYISGLGIGKHTGFLKGLDLQGGRSDGTGRGFVFLPPTIRPSKVTGEIRSYRAKSDPVRPPATDTGCQLLREYINEALGSVASLDPSAGRRPIEALRTDCLKAESGDQRSAMLAYVHELERQGVPPDEIVASLVLLTRDMPVYDTQRPWYPASGHRKPDQWLRGLLHRKGAVIADATPEEMEALEDLQGPARSGLIQWVQDIEERNLAWLWYGRLAFGEISLLDGAKGKGKSFVTYDLISCATRGVAMPGQDQAEIGPITVLLFTDEGGWDTTIRPRLRAAGADLSKVARVSPQAVRKKWGLPDGAKHIGAAIRESGAKLAVFDPITDMIGEEIQTHNDASVRRALAPLAQKLTEVGCAGLAIRHFNKMTGAGARNRGSGGSAFQNRARIHMITGELPDGQEDKFGLAIVDTNLTSKEGLEGVFGYTIVDSEVPTGDRQGSHHGKVEWGGIAEGVTADVLADGNDASDGRKSAATSNRRMEVAEVMIEMFAEKDEWSASDILDALREAGASTRKDDIAAVRASLNVRSVAVRVKGKPGVQGWLWTVAKVKAGKEGSNDD